MNCGVFGSIACILTTRRSFLSLRCSTATWGELGVALSKIQCRFLRSAVSEQNPLQWNNKNVQDVNSVRETAIIIYRDKALREAISAAAACQSLTISLPELNVVHHKVDKVLALGIAGTEKTSTIKQLLKELCANIIAIDAFETVVLREVNEPFDIKAEPRFGIGVCIVTLAGALALAFHGAFALGAIPGYYLCRRLTSARQKRTAALDQVLESKRKSRALKHKNQKLVFQLTTELIKLSQLETFPGSS